MTTELRTAAQHLMEVLEQENDALTRSDFAAAVALVAAKEAALLDLTKQQPVVGGPSPAVKASLIALGQRLSGLATENQSLLERAIIVQTRIVQIIARAAAPPPARAEYGNHRGKAASQRIGAMALSTRA